MTDDSMTREEAQSIKATEAMNDAERLLRHRRHGVLCTSSKRADGWPFASVVPYAIDDAGRPVILIATIAEHTRNIDADPRVSLLVQSDPPDGDVQADARLCVMGRATVIPDDELDAARARYLERLPEAEGYFATHDFSFRRISVERLRYIGGFGKIFWLDVEAYRARSEHDPLAASRDAIVDHVNADQVMVELARRVGAV